MTGTCPPGEHSRRNFRLEDYVAMVRAGECKFSIAEAARVMGVSRAYLYRCMLFASVSDEEFQAAVDAVLARGLTSSSAVADEIKRRTGRAKQYAECCPNCGHVLRVRER